MHTHTQNTHVHIIMWILHNKMYNPKHEDTKDKACTKQGNPFPIKYTRKTYAYTCCKD